MRGIDLVMAFPYILLALAIVAVLGPGLLNALYAIAIVNIPFFARNVRGITLGLSRREFVDAARLSGASHPVILFREVLPNVLPTIVVTMSTTVGWMILETAGLSFLGLGAQPPQADLGSMLGEGRKLLFTAPHVSVIPGLMIFVLVISINLVGDGVRDVLDPRLKSGALIAPGAATAVKRESVPQTPAPDAMMAVEGLRTEFHVGDRVYKAVGGVDLVLAPGERVGVVGESGSGKSVTALSLLRLVPTPPGVITGGRVTIDGRDQLAAPLDKLRTPAALARRTRRWGRGCFRGMPGLSTRLWTRSQLQSSRLTIGMPWCDARSRVSRLSSQAQMRPPPAVTERQAERPVRLSPSTAAIF
jgi:peptide/nickel transport system permease protein